MLSIFSCAFRPSVCHFFDWVVQFFLILSCMSCLYILETNPLLVASFANTFSHSEDCHFVFFMVFFAVQKLLSLIRSHLFIFIFIFIFITLRVASKNILLQFMSKNARPMFSSTVFIVSGLTFRSLIHLEFIFVHGVGGVLLSFVYMQLSCFPSTTY